MAKADQIKALIRSHIKNDEEHFATIALQLAASEAQRGHANLAKDIRELIDRKSKNNLKVVSINQDLDDLVISVASQKKNNLLFLEDKLQDKFDRIVNEFQNRQRLSSFGLKNRRKVLLAGPPGTGKTMSAGALAASVRLPYFVVQIDRLFTRYLGETNAKLRQVFSIVREQPGIYLFDEFDTLGVQRGSDNDVGEMRRILNALLQFIEEDDSQSLIIAATNNLQALDRALFRRLDDILHYSLPKNEQIEAVVLNHLSTFYGGFKLSPIVSKAKGLSHAEITEACKDALKDAILANKKKVTQKALMNMLDDRRAAYHPQS